MSPEEFDEVSRFVGSVEFDTMVSSRWECLRLGGCWATLGPVAGYQREPLAEPRKVFFRLAMISWSLLCLKKLHHHQEFCAWHSAPSKN